VRASQAPTFGRVRDRAGSSSRLDVLALLRSRKERYMKSDKAIAGGLIVLMMVGLVTASGMLSYGAAKLALYSYTGLVLPW
jgi:hypothetical protein